MSQTFVIYLFDISTTELSFTKLFNRSIRVKICGCNKIQNRARLNSDVTKRINYEKLQDQLRNEMTIDGRHERSPPQNLTPDGVETPET